MKYALVRNGAVDKIKEWGSESPPDLSHKIGDTLEWLPYIENAPPTHDTHREKLEASTTINPGVDVQKSWIVNLKSKEERKDAVDSYSASQVQGGLGDITDRLATMTQATMLLDALNQGQIANDDPSLVSLRALGAWWQATQAYAIQMKADIDADLDPDISAGWPVLGA